MTGPSEAPLGMGDGAAAVVAGIKVGLGEASLRGTIAVSLVVNAFLFALLVGGMLWYAFDTVEGWVAVEQAVDPGWWDSFVGWIAGALGFALKLAAVLGTFLVAPVIFTTLASMVLPAFHGPVYLAARRFAGGEVPDSQTGALEALARTVGIEVRRLLSFLALSLCILPLNLIPILGSILYLAAQLYLTAMTLGWDLMSYHFELHDLDFAAQKRFAREHKGLRLGLGGVGALLCLIPLAQVLFITTNVVGAGLASAWLDGATREES